MFLEKLNVAQNRRLLVRVAFGLLLVRYLERAPLLHPAPDLHRLFADEPLLATLDVFTGGALASFSVMALGVFPYVIGYFAARCISRPVRDAWDAKELDRLTRCCAAAAAVVLGSVLLFVMTQLGSAPALGALPAVADVASLTAAAQFFVWLGRTFLDERFGLPLLVAANISAALPRYLLVGIRSARDVLPLAFGFAITAGLLVVLRLCTQDVPMGSARRTVLERKATSLPFLDATDVLPFPSKRLDSMKLTLPASPGASGVFPLLFVLAGATIMRLGGCKLADANMHWIRRLAALERHLTDVKTSAFWVSLFCVGTVFKIGFDHARFDATGCADLMRKQGFWVVAVRPGRHTEDYLRGVSLRVATAGSILTMLPITVLGLYYSRSGQAGLWPLLLIPLLYTVHPVMDFLDHLEAAAAMRHYDRFEPHAGRIRGRRGSLG
jgi:preprotein translocase subunit SecY